MRVQIFGVDTLQKRTYQLQEPSRFSRAFGAGALHLKGKLAVVPPVSRRPQSHLWSPKQRRGFFAALRSGKIEVPYIRGSSPSSQNLPQRWRVTVRAQSAEISNNARYAGLVQGEKQTGYHRVTGWVRAADVVKKYGSETADIIRAELVKP